MKLITILGANGSIGVPLSKELKKQNVTIRQVSRNPKKVNESDEIMVADLTKPEDVNRAIVGSDIVIVTVGFEYKLSIWQKVWPPFIKSVVDSCARHKAKLVFFDNIYMIDPAHLANVTEESPIKPCTGKGEVRATVYKIIIEAMQAGKIEAIIARSADFITLNNSFFGLSLLGNLKKGKPADWLISGDKLHNFTYVDDAARALAMLVFATDTWNQVWNMPATKPLTGKQWVALCGKVTGTNAKISVVPGWLLTALGWFMPLMKEIGEMRYQWANDYIIKSDKIEKRFAFQATPLENAIAEIYQKLP